MWGRCCCSHGLAALLLSHTLPRCQPAMRHNAAAAVASSLRCASSLVGCHAHVVVLAVAMPLMELRRASHAGREHARLSTRAWTWVSTFTPTTSSQGAHMPSHRPYPTALSLFLICLPPSSHSHVRAREWSPRLNSARLHLHPPIVSRSTLHSLDDAPTKRQIGSFPPACR